jgi:hypothetical protein
MRVTASAVKSTPVVVSPSQWSSSTDPFLAELAGRPMVALPGFTGPLDLTGAR